ncbi:hypothetical protein [Sphingobium sp. MK2]|uniref:hypothetical protein n=1 Tax=Sphingobium sp. MK2 TaxID=3116540 RepID=UPI0032E35D09
MGKWYKQGLQDALDGICDPPWQEGHRDHTSYMEGQGEGETHLEREAYLMDRQDTQTVTRLEPGRWEVVDDAGANMTGDYRQLVEWLDAGLDDGEGA